MKVLVLPFSWVLPQYDLVRFTNLGPSLLLSIQELSHVLARWLLFALTNPPERESTATLRDIKLQPTPSFFSFFGPCRVMDRAISVLPYYCFAPPPLPPIDSKFLEKPGLHLGLQWSTNPRSPEANSCVTVVSRGHGIVARHWDGDF